MKAQSALRLLAWLVGPLVVLVLAGALGNQRARGLRGTFYSAPAALPAPQRKALESLPPLVVANATWALGNAESVKKMLRFELDRLPETEPLLRARVLRRFGVFDQNPEGQAAVFSQACANDPSSCTDEKGAVESEVKARLVPPGNHLPIFFIPNHPPILGL